MRPAVGIAALGLFVATLAWRSLTFSGFNNDHYAHVALAQQMLLGDRPIQDFSDPGWPLTYLLSAAAWLVGGGTLGTEWAITATGFALGAACTVVAASRLSGSLAIAIIVTVLEILIYPRTYSYPKMLVYGLIDRYLAEAYEPMAEIPVEGAATIRILVHRNRNVIRTDPETGWPCFQ